MDYWTRRSQILTDPEAAWPSFVSLLRDQSFLDDPEGYLQVVGLFENFMYDHGPVFIDRVETLALVDPTFRDVVIDAVVDGIGGESIRRFNALQDQMLAQSGRSRD